MGHQMSREIMNTLEYYIIKLIRQSLAMLI